MDIFKAGYPSDLIIKFEKKSFEFNDISKMSSEVSYNNNKLIFETAFIDTDFIAELSHNEPYVVFEYQEIRNLYGERKIITIEHIPYDITIVGKYDGSNNCKTYTITISSHRWLCYSKTEEPPLHRESIN
jgi:hypothetical protein